MGRCFVIQPFDKGAYDKRYEDVIVPAITGAGLEDYRVDRDASARILIDAIEQGIQESEACIAEITTDNPNVWYELGFAIAHAKPMVMICNEKERRSKYPFDIHNRPVISFRPESPRDFSTLQDEITKRLKALLEKDAEVRLMATMGSSKSIAGLSFHEMAVLRIVMENQLSAVDYTSTHSIQSEMLAAGFTKLATSLSMRSLEQHHGFLECFEAQDWWAYRVTPKGIDWLLAHQDHFPLVANAPAQSPEKEELREFTDDDVPF